MKTGDYFAAILCATTGIERASMALILYLGGRPVTRRRHHEVLKSLQSIVTRDKKKYQEITEFVAELMGHLTMVRYRYEVAGEFKTPREIYDEKIARELYGKAREVIMFVKHYTKHEGLLVKL
jgi:HEPN domain-containing protein